MRVIFAGGWRGKLEGWMKEGGRRKAEGEMTRQALRHAVMLPIGKMLRDLAWAFVQVRNAMSRHPIVRLPVPVISVGNITVGGTGKTPLTQWLCERLQNAGWRPAILTPLAMTEDEAKEHQQQSGVLVYGGRERVASARQAISDGATAIVLDDGFQYRRLHRDFDIVLWDATAWLNLNNPFLREPLTALRRATTIVLSKADAVDDVKWQKLCEQLNDWAGGEKAVVAFGYEASGFKVIGQWFHPAPIEKGLRVIATTSVANPHYFAQTAQKAGCEVVVLICFPDHHRFTPADAALVAECAKCEHADAVVTTRKDAVKWQRVWQSDVPLMVLEVRLHWLFGETELWQRILTTLNPERPREAQRERQ